MTWTMTAFSPAGLILYDDGAIRGRPKESGVFPL